MSPPHTAPASSVLPAAPCVSSVDRTQWFKDEIHAHDGKLKAYVKGTFPSVRDVEDVVQESYLRIWKVRATQRVHSAKALLFTIARHIALDRIRRERNSPIAAVADLAAIPVLEEGRNGAEAADQQEKVRFLGSALALLPDRTREIVVLRRFKGLSQKEVAARLGITEAAVEHHVARGLRRCEDYLRRQGINDLYERR